ncbi:YihY/virulence factor BrkB family protein [Georgenia faecalis]|uniref:YihY/virulence factor BrkB family protein n=1 Tax=Georgenia faecalis TaxID=2483799 RepID=A0ABV9D8P0_9MICO|nr:YihY/virulence factor BrkB family protein [Georgenia faecalis]
MATAIPRDGAGERAAGAGTGLAARVRAGAEAVQHSRVGRAVARYFNGRGGLLAGGVTYSALFSISAALTIGYTAFVTVLGDDATLRRSVLDALNDALPGVVSVGGRRGLIDPDSLILSTALGPASIAAAAVLVWTAISMMNALRRSIQTMFGIVSPLENMVRSRLRDLGAFVLLALAVLVTAVLGIGAGAAGGWVVDLLGIQGTLAAVLLRVAGIGVVLVVDCSVFVMLFRVLAGVRAPRRDLLVGALVGGVAASALRQLGTSVVVGRADDPILASFAALATLLLWVNLLARITLFIAAWTANPPAPPRPKDPEATHFGERPNYVTVSVPATLEWDYDATTGTVQPSADDRDAVAEEDLRRAGPAGEAVLEARTERQAARDRERELAARAHELEVRFAREQAPPAGAPAGPGGTLTSAVRGLPGRARRWWNAWRAR